VDCWSIIDQEHKNSVLAYFEVAADTMAGCPDSESDLLIYTQSYRDAFWFVYTGLRVR
jgi:hypothetical protein